LARFERKSPPFRHKTRQAWGTLSYPVFQRNIDANREIGVARKSSAWDGVVAFEGVADVVGGDGTETADAPVIAFEFDDGGRHDPVGFARVKDQREAIAKLTENFLAAGAGGRAGDVGAGAGERDADFGDEIRNNFRFGPTESDATGVGGDFEGETVGRVDDDGKRTGPEGFGEAIEVVREVFGENERVIEMADEDREGAVLGAPFDAENLFDSGEVDGIGGQSVEGVGGDGGDRTAVEPGGSVADDARVGIGYADFEDLS
jgi:hypothetical protein